MEEQNNKEFHVYPIYFDSSISCAQGRKCPIDKGISKPTFKEVKQALDLLGLKYTGESEKRHPKDVRSQGRFKISGTQLRRSIMDNIISKLKEVRNNTGSKAKESANVLNLVARSKKKSKK